MLPNVAVLMTGYVSACKSSDDKWSHVTQVYRKEMKVDRGKSSAQESTRFLSIFEQLVEGNRKDRHWARCAVQSLFRALEAPNRARRAQCNASCCLDRRCFVCSG
jgi:hypothetical protein